MKNFLKPECRPLTNGSTINPPTYPPQMGVLHRDIKPENFLMSSVKPGATVKLADFGLSCFYNRGEPERELVGSPFYVAPELLGKEGYGPAADVWSCGVILFHFLSRELPFKVRARPGSAHGISRGSARSAALYPSRAGRGRT